MKTKCSSCSTNPVTSTLCKIFTLKSLMLSIELFIQITVFKDCLSNLDCFNGGYCLRLSSSVSVCSCQPGYTGNRMFFFIVDKNV